MDRQRPYNDLPLLPPRIELETRPVLKRCVTARTALAELRLAGHLIPDQSVLINSIPLLEAKDSSEIENIVTTNDELFREAGLGDGTATPETKEAARYRTALRRGFETIESLPVSTRLATEICRVVTGKDYDVRRTTGTRLQDRRTGDIYYTPPEGEARLREMLANWEKFANDSTELDPLVRMAVLHYQFEAIHPFPDGNGRTGRILNILGLVQDGLLDLPTLYLSRYILENRGAYYRLLGRVTSDAEWEPWILYMLEAVEVTSAWTTRKIRAVKALMDDTVAFVRANAPKLPHAVVELIFTHPYVRISNVVESKIVGREAAAKYLKDLAALGVLEEEKIGRDKIFIHRKYLDVLFSGEHAFEPYRHAGQQPAATHRSRGGK
ncbi:MAG: Fic family protein [Hyphomicrobiaceae bacterium]|nr:MAG: Fic family protein [Hyphomicrobiaceae bacterium]